MVELALVCPLFFLLLIASFEFARLNMIRNTANAAAYEGVRRVIVPGASAQEAIDETNRILGYIGTRNATVTVDPPVLDPDTPQVTVNVEIPFDDNGFLLPQIARNVVIRASSTHDTERFE